MASDGGIHGDNSHAEFSARASHLAGTARLRKLGLLLGPAACLAILMLPAPEDVPIRAWRTASVGVFMAVWWTTGAVPLPVTALLPLALFPVLGILEITGAAAPYANPIIGLFLGGFLLARAMERWNLHRRVAFTVIAMVGTRPDATVGGFMVAAALLSMWISNTATAVMLLPIGVSTVALMTQGDRTGREGSTHDPFGVVLMLGIAYACSIGGLGTLIGSPPNALLAAFMAEHYDIEIGFGRWMLVGVPLVLVSLPLTWAVLTHGLYRMPPSPAAGGLERLRRERISLGRMSRGEIMVASVFVVTAAAWMLRPVLSGWVPGLSDAGIGIAAAILLFVLPVDLTKNEFVLTWDFAKTLPWEVLLLFGGGLSLANAISDTGLATWLGQQLSGLDAVPLGVTLVVVVAAIVLLTEVTSNTATAATFLPILASLAVALDHPPILLTAPAALAASCAFMMPVATPPNAIVYGSGHVTVPQMVRAGLILNALFIVLLSTLGTWLIRQAFV